MFARILSLRAVPFRFPSCLREAFRDARWAACSCPFVTELGGHRASEVLSADPPQHRPVTVLQEGADAPDSSSRVALLTARTRAPSPGRPAARTAVLSARPMQRP